MNTTTIHPRSRAYVQQPRGSSGQEFEAYIISLFDSENFRLLAERSVRRAANGAFPLYHFYPELELEHKPDSYLAHRFAVACSWCGNDRDGMVKWADAYHLADYLEFEDHNRVPLFITIGVGGTESNPERLYVAPLRVMGERTLVPESELQPFAREPRSRFYFDSAELKLV